MHHNQNKRLVHVTCCGRGNDLPMASGSLLWLLGQVALMRALVNSDCIVAGHQPLGEQQRMCVMQDESMGMGHRQKKWFL